MEIKLGLQMGLGNEQAQIQTLLPQLDDVEKGQIMKAIEFWESKPHDKLTISINQLRMLFGERPKAQIEGLERADIMEEEFVMLDPEEMDEIDTDEKVGSQTSDIIFVAKNTPEEYVGMVVLNLVIHKRIKIKDEEIMELLQNQGIQVDDIDVSRHWSANLFDIMIAEKQFTPKKFRQYLEWRKKVEQTNFFRNPDMHEFMQKMLNYKKYKKTTNPGKRQKYGRRSWNVSGGMMSWGNNFVDQCGKDMMMSRVDVIFRKLSQLEEYDPETMMRTLNFILKNVEGVREKGERKVNKIDFSEHSKLSNQAYLMTEDVIGTTFALLEQIGDSDEYKLASQYRASIEAIKDRIAYFYRESIKRFDENNHVTQKLVSAIKNRSELMIQDKEGEVIPIDINSQAANSDALNQEVSIQKKLEAISQMMKDYEAIEQRIKEKAQMDSQLIIPGSIDKDKAELTEAQRKLESRLEGLDGAKDIIDDLERLRMQRKALLSEVEMGEPVKLIANN